MATLQQMKIRIARELPQNPEVYAQISEAVDSAISHYERQRFWFNEMRATTPTVLHQETYAVPDDFIEADQLQLTSNGTQWRLEPMPYEWFAERDHQNPVYGQSSYWTIYQNQIWVWPVPDTAAYTITLSYVKKIAAITDNESNEWTVEAERLIRSRAKYYLCLDVLHDAALAQQMKSEEFEALRETNREVSRRATSGRILARYL